MAWQKIAIDISDYDLKPQQRQDLADLVIEHIFDRTNRGLDKNNVPFKKYSKEYENSLAFKAAGKIKGGKPNLQLSGDMLAAMKLLSENKKKLLIGFENNTEENGKAEGNIKGTYGQATSTGKKRDFLGIKNDKLKELIAEVTDG